MLGPVAWPGLAWKDAWEAEGAGRKAKGTCVGSGPCWGALGSCVTLGKYLSLSGLYTHRELQIEFAFWFSTSPGVSGLARRTHECACGGVEGHISLACQPSTVSVVC